MHIPDGFIDIPTSIAFTAVSTAAVGVALKQAKNELSEKTAPLAGLTAVFIFAVQMLNFPVAAGTSGHLLGGALAAVLVGPWVATLALTIVLLLQALLFADGGLTALGLNVFNISILAVWIAYFIFIALKKVLPKTKTSLIASCAIAALISVPASAFGFWVQYAIGGNATFPLETVLTAMISTHILIGIGEAIITVLTVSAIMASRSDLVFGWKNSKKNLVIN
ncbi:MAG: energy-coupling factor ABC transporter permease [Candidatus Nanopelagicales bacterium]|jgi:cobalamin biosynthesis protein CbiM|nr:cobalamin biosynthesis protein CbiM [Actinomycetota bacterium]